MPNWCENKLSIKGNAEDIKKFKDLAVGYSAWGSQEVDDRPNLLEFHKLYPIPEEILKGGYDPAGYNWEILHWGCEWDPDYILLNPHTKSHLIYEFPTPWKAPLALLKHIAPQWPNLEFELFYTEPNGHVKGMARAKVNTFEIIPADLVPETAANPTIETLRCYFELKEAIESATTR